MDGKLTMPERMNEVYKYALSRGKAENKQSFAELMGVTNVTLSRFLTGRAEPARKTLEIMNERMGGCFNIQWLILGTGEMLSNGQETDDMPLGQESIITAFNRLMDEMQESRRAKDAQIDRLLSIIEKMQAK